MSDQNEKEITVGPSAEVLSVGVMNNVSEEPMEEIMTLEELETMYLRGVLLKLKNKTKVAKALGISLKTLYNKLHKNGMFAEFATYGSDEAPKD